MGLLTIKQNITQFLAIISIGAIAVTLFVGLLANAQSIEQRVNSAFSSSNLSDIYVTTQSYDSNDLSNIKNIVGSNGEVEERLYFEGKVKSKSMNIAVTKSVPTISKPYEYFSTSSTYTTKNFFILDNELNKENNSNSSVAYSLDEEVQIDFDISSFNLTDQEKTVLSLAVKEGGTNIFAESSLPLTIKVNAFAKSGENIQKSAYNTSTAYLSDSLLKEAFLNVIKENYNVNDTFMGIIEAVIAARTGFGSIDGQFYVPNQYLVHVYDENKIDTFKKNIDSYFSSKGTNNLYINVTKDSMPFYLTINTDVTQAQQFTFVFPFVFFLVAILVILTTMSQIVLKDRTQIGTLKALGVSRFKILLHYASLTFFLVLIGTIIGEILGPIIIPGILGEKYSILYSLPTRTFTFPLYSGIATAVVFLLVSVFVTYLICRHEVSLKPVESMRPAVKKVKAIAKGSNKKTSPFKLSIKMAIRNIRMSFTKSMMVLVGVLGCTALLCCGFGIEDTIYHGIDIDLSRYENADITLTLNSPLVYDDCLNITNGDSDIIYNEPYSLTTTKANKIGEATVATNLYLLSEENNHFKITFDSSKAAVSQKTADKMSLEIGDKINFTYLNNTYEVEVGYIYETFAHLGIVVSKDNSIFKNTTIKYSSLYLDIKEGVDADIKAETMLSNSKVGSYTTQKTWREHVNNVISGFLVMTNAVKVFAILLAIVVLYNLSLMNFKERTRDMATLKVLGFSEREIFMSLIFEILLLTLLGSLFGLALGYPFMLLVMKTNIVELVQYIYTINISSYLISFALTFVVAFIINLLFSRKIKSIKMVESLKSVE